MSNEQIPQKIIDQINDTLFMTGGNSDPEKDFYMLGAKFGFSLAADQLRKKDEEIERLKNLTKEQIRTAILKKYQQEFGDFGQEGRDAYFITGFVDSAIDDLFSSLPVKQEENQDEIWETLRQEIIKGQHIDFLKSKYIIHSKK